MNTQEQWPKISIVTVSYNQGEFIRQNIESVLQQQYPNFEHLVIDGGSTDGTVEILKSYPHLRWTSEPDRGQSDALNKGFSRATGEIIGWLNSDDWYAPGVFFDVARELRDHPIVLGSGQETGKDGSLRQVVPNTERDFFDILKYWVPFAWLAQPPIFFRRDLLEQARRPDGTYLDEDLYFCMDFDLWARMAALIPFTRRIDRVLACYRIYDENKTGKYPLATQRECGRVFRRYSYTLSSTEHKFSFVIPANSISHDISATLQSIAAQRLKDFEIVFVDYSGSREFAKQLREFTLELSAAFNHNSVRFIKSDAPNLYTALNNGIQAACALLVVTLREGDVLGSDFLVEASDLFIPDCQGLALPLAWKPDLKAMLFNHEPNQLEIRIDSIFKMPYIFPNFVARKVTMLELNGLLHTELPPLALRELIARVAHKSWAISVNNSLSLTPMNCEYRAEAMLLEACDPYINAKIALDLAQELEQFPFARVRLENGITFAIPDALRRKSEQLIQDSPSGWYSLAFKESVQTLRDATAKFPRFAPAWYFLAETVEGPEGAEARRKFENLRQEQWAWL